MLCLWIPLGGLLFSEGNRSGSGFGEEEGLGGEEATIGLSCMGERINKKETTTEPQQILDVKLSLAQRLRAPTPQWSLAT